MAYAFRGSGTNAANSSGTVLIAGSVGSVAAGDLVICWTRYEGADTTTTVSDGTSTFTPATRYSHGVGLVGQFHYLLASVATGVVSCTQTLTAARQFRAITTMVFSKTGTPTFDAENGATGTSASLNSGNIATADTDEVVVGGYSNFGGGLPTSEQINGVAATAVVDDPNSLGSMRYRILTSTFGAGAATGSISSFEWVCAILAIKATAGGGGGSVVPVLMRQYRQRKS